MALVPGIRQLSPSDPALGRTATTPQSWLGHGTLLTVYGRGFGTAPILGRLGMDRSLDDVGRQLEPAGQAIIARGGGPVRIAIHLIYALATPCSSAAKCLLYLDDAGVDLVKQYIEPAARRGWLVILDDQLGRSSPKAEVQRLLDRGYLAYDNVEVAFDPEFRTAAGQATPGIPTGQVAATELNDAQLLIDSYSRHQGLPHRKLLLVHQWKPEMIQDRDQLRGDLPYVQPVVVMDGIGSPEDKAHAYRQLLESVADGEVLPGIKLFPFNPYDPNGHRDEPLLSWDQIFGLVPAQDGQGRAYYVDPVPRVIVMT